MMSNIPKWGAPPPPVRIIPQPPPEPPVTSSVLAHFVSPQQPNIASPPPPPANVDGGIQSNIVEAQANGTPVTQSRHAADPVELTVFKHKGVNSLILNRILALENSVVSKTIDKQPLKEVDDIIKEVMKDQEDDEIVEQLKRHKAEEAAIIPTSKIRQLAKEMHEPRPEFNYSLPIVSLEEKKKENVVKQAPPKPIITKQYSFSMDRKFHEEIDDDGWNKVDDFAAVESSESESEDTDESDEVSSSDSDEIPLPPPMEKHSILNVESSNHKDTDSEDISSSDLSDEEEPPKKQQVTTRNSETQTDNETAESLDRNTVDRILDYDEDVDIDPLESFEEYIRRRTEQPGYDSDVTQNDSDYDSETNTEYSQNTNAYDNDSFVNDRYYDPEAVSRSEYSDDGAYKDDDGAYRYDSAGEERGAYYPDVDGDSLLEEAYEDRHRDQYYTDDDEQTLVDEDEYVFPYDDGRRMYSDDERYYSDDYTVFSDDYTSEYDTQQGQHYAPSQEGGGYKDEFYSDEEHSPYDNGNYPASAQGGGGNSSRDESVNDRYRQQPPLNDGYRQEPPLNDGYRQQPPLNDGYRQEPPPNDGYRQQPPLNDGNQRQPDDGDAYYSNRSSRERSVFSSGSDSRGGYRSQESSNYHHPVKASPPPPPPRDDGFVLSRPVSPGW